MKKYQLKDIQKAIDLKQEHEHLDAMMRAFIEVTGLNPEDIELVREKSGSETRWFYRRKQEARNDPRR